MIKTARKSIVGNGIETVKNLTDSLSSENYRGSAIFTAEPTNDRKKMLEDICPTKALFSIKENNAMGLDNGKCIMCGYCSEATPQTIKISNKPAIPAKMKSQMIDYSIPQTLFSEKSYEQIGNELKEKIQKMFGRSLAIRQVDAGSCNGCEIEIAALNNPIYDIERFGIHFVASPRHADVLLVTGPASRNMEIAVLRTYEATPGPKIVIAVGACACSGGIFGDTYATTGGIDKILPVDVYIPGCPPRPEILLQGLLLAINRMKT
ncbi:MAG TPA: NADH-quinone oxidoreductase subunit NuoB [Candidatus Nitrosotalea sp.]|nr:NADH-quinone oxidoreductase subunit NuoB [Candidatus Nitrosotalea sp.]